MTENVPYIVSSTVSIHPFCKFLFSNSSFQDDTLEFEEEAPENKLDTTTSRFNEDSIDTSNFKATRPSLEVEKSTLGFVAKYEQEQKELLLERISNEIVARLQFFTYDDESIEPVWTVCDRIIDETSLDILGTALQGIYLSHNDCPNILCGICKYLTTYDLDEVTPWGPLILIGLLNHKDETVKEYAVLLLDNWKDKKLIPVLRNLDCQATWLQAYIKDVLLSLGG